MLDRCSDRTGDLLVGIAMVGFVFGWDAVVIAVGGTSGEGLAEPAAWAAAAVACAALFFRGSFPLTVTIATLACSVVYYPASSIDGPTVATFVIALYTLAARGRILAASITTAAAFVALIVPEALSGFVHVSLVSTLLMAGWFVAIVAIGAVVAHYRRYRVQMAAALEEGKRRSVAEERLRIARELHDAVGHHLSLINVQASAAARRLRRDPGYEAGETLRLVADTSRTSLRELRAMVGVLREAGEDSPTGPGPGLDQLPSLVEAARAGGLDVAFTQDGAAELPAAVDAAAYRVVQESLTNVIRHAEAEHVEVRVAIGSSELSVRIADDGKAQADKGVSGNGMAGMRERAESLGGTFDAGPRDGGGFRVEAAWPLEVEP